MEQLRAMNAHSYRSQLSMGAIFNRNTEILVAGLSRSQSVGLLGGKAPMEFSMADMENWDVDKTVVFLQGKGLSTYATHFQEEEYNGGMMLLIDDEDIKAMPETNAIKRKSFSALVN